MALVDVEATSSPSVRSDNICYMSKRKYDIRRVVCLTSLMVASCGSVGFLPCGCAGYRFFWHDSSTPVGQEAINPAAATAAAPEWPLAMPVGDTQDGADAKDKGPPAPGPQPPAQPASPSPSPTAKPVNLAPIVDSARVITESVVSATPAAPWLPIIDLIFRAIALVVAWTVRPKDPAPMPAKGV